MNLPIIPDKLRKNGMLGSARKIHRMLTPYPVAGEAETLAPIRKREGRRNRGSNTLAAVTS